MYSIQKLDSSTFYQDSKKIVSAVPEKQQTALSQDEMAKVARLQAHIRGWKARNEVFLPQQILPFVEEHFVEYKLNKRDYLNIARFICSELNKISSNPQAFKGQSTLVETKLKYTFFEPGEKPINVSRPFDLHLDRDDAGKNMEILAMPDAKRKGIVDGALGKGAFKLIYRAQDISVSRELISNQRKVKHTFSVLVVPIKGNEVFQKGYNIHKEILETVQGKFVELYVPLKPSIQYSSVQLYKQIWYNGTFQDAAKQGSVPINFFPNSKQVEFTLKDKLKVFSDVAKSLQAMHEKGYVHRDIKANNLFIKLNPEQKPEGYIGDFDIAQKIGVSDFFGFMNEDKLGANGLIFPTTDIYGLALALRECLVPVFLEGGLFFNYVVNDSVINRTLTEHFYRPLKSLSQSMHDQVLKEIHARDSSGIKLRYSPQERIQMYENFLLTQVEMSTIINQFTVKDSGEIEPSCSFQELIDLLQNLRSHSTSLDIQQTDVLNRLEMEIMLLNEMFVLIKDVLTKENSLDIQQIKKEVQELKDPAELLNYFNNKIVPQVYDPKEVCEKIQLLAKRLQ